MLPEKYYLTLASPTIIILWRFTPELNPHMADELKRKLEDQIRTLEHELNHELPAELKKARAHGDLSENAEYHAAKERQGIVNARLGQLRQRLAEVSLLNFNNIPRDRVAFGSTVIVHDVAKGSEVQYKIVTSEDADFASGRISTSSPIGRGLIGKQVGDIVTIQTPAGPREFEIRKLTTIHEEA
jgi:transcription elongation factor GreA